MSTSKHPKAGVAPGIPTPPDDLERNPGIGGAKGAFARSGEDPETIEGDNTFEGDTESGTNAQGGLNPDAKGRTNK